MKIATYNIWNSDHGMPEREQQIIDQIKSLDADVIALQEVRDQVFNQKLAYDTGYEHFCFASHKDGLNISGVSMDEGLSVLSKHPIIYLKHIKDALIVIIKQHDQTILFVNVHLPWDSVLAQEKSIVNIMNEIATLSSDYRFILGDFNCAETSSVHQYIKGYRSLNNTEVKHYWTDLALVAEEFLGIEIEKTLDLSTNPRWKGRNLTDISMRVDGIFIHDCFPKAYPTLYAFSTFGKEINSLTGLCASDHYGVVAELIMPYEVI